MPETKSETELTLRNVESELGISSCHWRLTLGLSEENSTMTLFRTANALRSKFRELFNLCVKSISRLGSMREARRFALLTNTILPFRCETDDDLAGDDPDEFYDYTGNTDKHDLRILNEKCIAGLSIMPPWRLMNNLPKLKISSFLLTTLILSKISTRTC